MTTGRNQIAQPAQREQRSTRRDGARALAAPAIAVLLLGIPFLMPGCDEETATTEKKDPKPTPEQPDVPGWSTLLEANKSLSEGNDDVALSADGSWRYRRVRNGDQLLEEHVTNNDWSVWEWLHSMGNANGALDADGDGITEIRYTMAPAAGPDVTIVVSLDPEDDGSPVARIVYTLAGGVLHVSTEQADGAGGFTVVDAYDTTSVQALSGAEASVIDASCTDAGVADQLVGPLVEGVNRGFQCLDRYGLKGELGLLAERIASRGVKVSCGPLSNNACAQVDIIDSALRGALLSGPIGITVDPASFFNNIQCESNQASGMFHELLHVALGPHNPLDTPQSDRIYGCQRLCFNGSATERPQVTRCECAACLETDECDDRCKDFPPCKESGACGPEVTILSTPCNGESCSCGSGIEGIITQQSVQGNVRGPVLTTLRVNANPMLGGTIDCDAWTEIPCAPTLCCQRTDPSQPIVTFFEATQPMPPNGVCACGTSTLPGLNWVAQALTATEGDEEQKTGPSCP